jgi:serine/threonine protein kinase
MADELADQVWDLIPEWARCTVVRALIVCGADLTDWFSCGHLEECYKTSDVGSYVLLNQLGAGAFGKVFKARHKDTGEHLAAKCLSKDFLASLKNGKEVLRAELDAWEIPPHEHVITVHDIVDSASDLLVMTTYASLGDALVFANRYPDSRLPPRAVLKMVKEAALGLAHIHGHNFIHRDIKPDNILVHASGIAMIGDMGSCARFERDDCLEGWPGTINYGPPEVLAKMAYKAPSPDMWSLGVSMYQLATGRLPFQSKRALREASYSVDDVPADAVCLLGCLINVDPAKRLSAAKCAAVCSNLENA